MKKNIILVLVLCLAVVGLVGCGSSDKSGKSKVPGNASKSEKVLTCTKSEDGATQYLNIGFNGDVVDAMDLLMEFKESDMSSEEKEMISKFDLCDMFKEDAGMNDCKTEHKNGVYSLSGSVDIEKFKQDAIEEGETDFSGSYEEAKEYFTKDGYSCS